MQQVVFCGLRGYSISLSGQGRPLPSHFIQGDFLTKKADGCLLEVLSGLLWAYSISTKTPFPHPTKDTNTTIPLFSCSAVFKSTTTGSFRVLEAAGWCSKSPCIHFTSLFTGKWRGSGRSPLYPPFLGHPSQIPPLSSSSLSLSQVGGGWQEGRMPFAASQ